VIAQGAANDTYGVRFASETVGTGGNLTITNSRFVVDKNVFVAEDGTYHSAIIIRAGATGALKVENSSILGDVVNLATPELDASPNWWGDPDGPIGAGYTIVGNVIYDPWLELYINLDNRDIDENQPIGTLVGKFSGESGDDDDLFSFWLESDLPTCPGADNASFTIGEDGVSLLSAEEFNYEAQETYQICVGMQDPWEHNVAQVFEISINDLNDAPVLAPIVYDPEINEGELLSFPVSATDEDTLPSADTLTFELIGAPTGAEITSTGTGTATVTWTPLEEQGPGLYTFTVRVRDNDYPSGYNKLFDEESVTVKVDEVNVAPVAVPDFYIGTLEPLTVPAPGVLLNDTDADRPYNTLSAYLTAQIPAGEGWVELNEDGSFTYMPPAVPPADGDTTFSYEVFDGTVYSATAVDVTIRFDDTWPTDISLSPQVIDENTFYTGTLTNNDPDDGDLFTYALVEGEGDTDNGKFKIDEDKLLTVSPFGLNHEEKEDYSVRIRVTDKYGAWFERFFTIHVNDVNDAPVLAEIPTPQYVDELSELTFTATATDEDIPAQDLTFSLSGAPDYATIDPITGEFWWGPSEFQGPGTYDFAVEVSDGSLTDTQTIRVIVREVNQAPVLNPIGNKQVNELDTLTFNVSATDGDVPVQALKYYLYSDDVTPPVNYGATLGETTGVFSWTPDELQGPGDYQFTICVEDAVHAEDCEDITITVKEVNIAPVGNPDAYNVIDEPLVVSAADGVLKNDTDADEPGNELSAVLVDNVPSGEGTLVFSSDGSFIFTPPATLPSLGFTTFTYRAFDGLAYSEVTTVTLTMRNTNQPPTDLTLTPTAWDENKDYVGQLASTDADFGAPFEAFTYELVDGPGGVDNHYFEISGNELKADPFNYEVKTSYNVRIRTTDLFGEYFEKAFIIVVNDVNDAPVAYDQGVITYKDQPIEIILTGSDEDSDPIDFAIFTEPQHGSLDSIGTGSFITTENGTLRLIAPNVIYTPDDGYVGPDSFTFKVRDPEGAVSVEPATVSIMVNDIPVAHDDSFDATEDTLLAIEEPGVLGNDENALELEELVAVLVDGPSHGEQFLLSPDGAFTYMPVANYNGVDTFTYKACEGSDCSNIATVTINIAAVNDAPVANDMSVETDEDTTKWITLNVSDVDGDDLVASIVTPPAHGVAVVSGTVVIYTPEADWNGLDEFTYKVNDGELDSNLAVISVNVTPVNDAPVANDMDVEALENTPKEITLDVFDVDNPVEDLVVTILAGPSHGTAVVNGIVVTYTPTAGFSGEDAFSYKVSDGELESLVSTVRITVNPLPIIHFYLPLILK
jgi:hypothetical protein